MSWTILSSVALWLKDAPTTQAVVLEEGGQAEGLVATEAVRRVVADPTVEDGGSVAAAPTLVFGPAAGVEDDGFVEVAEEFGIVEVEAGGDLSHDTDGEGGFVGGAFADDLIECCGHFLVLLTILLLAACAR